MSLMRDTFNIRPPETRQIAPRQHVPCTSRGDVARLLSLNMDVTRETFAASLEALDAAIEDPHFAFWSFDLEFTGLSADRSTKFDLFDTIPERWRKVHACVSQFTVLQYGVCCFAFDPKSRRWTVRPFNFWLFPDSSRGSTETFSCQASSLGFLSSCDFDFNKCVREGVPFTSPSAARRAEARRARDEQRPPIVPSNERDVDFVNQLKEDVGLWLGNARSPETLTLAPVNGFLRALTYQTLENTDFGRPSGSGPGFVAATVRENGDPPRIQLSRATLAEVARARAAEAAARAAADLAARGVAVAIQKLADSGVPAVGHNGMFDACYTLEKFLRETDGSLDAARAAFDERFGCPYYDTKLLAQTFLDAYAAAGSLRAPGSARAEDNLANTVPPLDTALGPLYETLTECALPRMMAKENEAAGAAPEAAEAGAPGPSRPSPARRRGGGRGVVGVQERPETSAPRPARGAGDRLLDWFEFPEGFERYAFALEPRGEPRVGSASRASEPSFAHEAGYDAFMTGACFLAMTLHARSVVPVDGDGVVRVFAENGACSPRTGSDAFVATKNDGGALPPRGFVGRLGACPFANADGAIPLQMSDAGVLRLRGAQPLTPTRAGVVVFTGVADDLSISALTPRFVAAGLGAPWQVAWIGKNTLRVTFRGGDADASGRDDAGARFAKDVARRLLALGTRVQAVDLATWRRREAAEKAAARAAEALERAHGAGVDIETLAAATRKTAERRRDDGGRKRKAFGAGLTVLLGGGARKAARRGGIFEEAGEVGASISPGRAGDVPASRGNASPTGCVVS